MTFWDALARDWISVAVLLVGLAGIFGAGFLAGRLWERGDHVRRVMTGAEPPPDPFLLTDDDLARILRDVRTRPVLFDWEQDPSLAERR